MIRISVPRVKHCLPALLIISLFASFVLAQSDFERQAVAINYPLDQSVTVKFRGTQKLPRLKGEAKVKRSGRRGTRVELSVEDLPRASELGGAYTTYILWAISPEGRVDNMGEIKRGGSVLVNSKIDVTTFLKTFALIVTAEPHYLVRQPSRMVVLENLPPLTQNNAPIETFNVQYLGNTSDYFDNPRVPEIADPSYQKTPVNLLGARQALELARYAGAPREVPDAWRDASEQLTVAEQMWRQRQPESDIDDEARRAISLAVQAEETALNSSAARRRREEKSQADASIRVAEDRATGEGERAAALQKQLDDERHQRELLQRDADNASDRVRELQSESTRLREELARVRAESEDAKIRLARAEERIAILQAAPQTAPTNGEGGNPSAETPAPPPVDLRAAAAALKQDLARVGTVKETARGLVLTLPETFWSGTRNNRLTPIAVGKLGQLSAIIAGNPYFQLQIEAHTDNLGTEAELRQLTEERARALAEQLITAGVDGGRIYANGMGASVPVAPNTKAARAKNRRTEIIFSPLDQTNATSAN